MARWRRKWAYCWTITDNCERWYPVKVRVIRRRLLRYRVYDLINQIYTDYLPWYRLKPTLGAARRLARRTNRRARL